MRRKMRTLATIISQVCSWLLKRFRLRVLWPVGGLWQLVYVPEGSTGFKTLTLPRGRKKCRRGLIFVLACLPLLMKKKNWLEEFCKELMLTALLPNCLHKELGSRSLLSKGTFRLLPLSTTCCTAPTSASSS